VAHHFRPGTPAPLQALATLSLLSALSGCGGEDLERVDTVPAGGTVLFKGCPLPDALVVLEPVEPQTSADGTAAPYPSGTTDASGKYRLRTYGPDDDGAPPGRYRVKVSTAPTSGADTGILRKRPKSETADPLRGRYLDPGASGLTATVGDGPTELPTLDLK